MFLFLRELLAGQRWFRRKERELKRKQKEAEMKARQSPISQRPDSSSHLSRPSSSRLSDLSRPHSAYNVSRTPTSRPYSSSFAYHLPGPSQSPSFLSRPTSSRYPGPESVFSRPGSSGSLTQKSLVLPEVPSRQRSITYHQSPLNYLSPEGSHARRPGSSRLSMTKLVLLVN